MLHAPRDAVRINEFEKYIDLSNETCSISTKCYFTLLQIRYTANKNIKDQIKANWQYKL